MQYDNTINWSDLYDDNNIKYRDITISLDNYTMSDDSDQDDDDDILINSDIHFSLDNEKILKKIDDIIKTADDFNKYPDLEILKNEDLISTYLSKYVIQNNCLDYNFFIRLLDFLYLTCTYLSNKLKLPIYEHDKVDFTNGDYIPRCSYKFCSYKDKCSYNYDEKKGGCYADHYVHNMVVADIDILRKYISYNYEKQKSTDGTVVHNQEIIKCMNTISFVIKHMYEELNNICIYIQSDQHHIYHVNKKAEDFYIESKKKDTKMPQRNNNKGKMSFRKKKK